jgi:hypothetical protein
MFLRYYNQLHSNSNTPHSTLVSPTDALQFEYSRTRSITVHVFIQIVVLEYISLIRWVVLV